MSECTRFTQAEELQAQGQLYGAAMSVWQEHVRECATCALQQSAAIELGLAMSNDEPPSGGRDLAARVLRRVRAEQAAAQSAPLPRRAVWLLVLNWVSVAAVCVALAAMIRPPDGDFRSVSFVLPTVFLAGCLVATAALRRPTTRPEGAGAAT